MSLSREAQAALDEVLAREDPDVLGIVLSGSAARGMATEHSDVDVYVVLTDDEADRRPSRKTPAIDEIPKSMADLEDVPPWGTNAYYFRWSFAHAQVLRDDTGGRISEAVLRQATLTPAEARYLLVDGDQLDGYINFAYRALKSARDGRLLESRLDAVETMAWWLNVVFALEGRVRPYNKYLAWELREFPLSVPEWSAETLLPQLVAVLEGDADAVRAAYLVVERECRPHPHLWGVVESWGDELAMLRGAV